MGDYNYTVIRIAKGFTNVKKRKGFNYRTIDHVHRKTTKVRSFEKRDGYSINYSLTE